MKIKKKRKGGNPLAKWTTIIVAALLITVMYSLSVLAVPSVEHHTGTYGLEIKYPPIEVLAKNQDYTFGFHVYNSLDGLPVTDNINCTFHLYNTTGKHLYITSTTTVEHGYDYEVVVDGGNFSSEGLYNFLIQCNGTVQEHLIVNGAESVVEVHRGGFVDEAFSITESGYVMDNDEGFLYGIIMLVSMLMIVVFLMIGSSRETENKYSVDGKSVEIAYGKYLKLVMYYLAYMSFLFLNFLVYTVTDNTVMSFARGTFHTFFLTTVVLLGPISIALVLKVSIDFYKDLGEWKTSKEGRSIFKGKGVS